MASSQGVEGGGADEYQQQQQQPPPRRHRASDDAMAREGAEVSNAATKRLCRRAGVLFIKKKIYSRVNTELASWMEELLQAANNYREHSGRNTIMSSDVIHALKLMGQKIYN